MPKFRELSESERMEILKEHYDGKSNRKIVDDRNISHSCVNKLIKKGNNYGTVKTLPGRGRKKIASSRDITLIKREVLKN